jgi:quercetin dioxygenase-like cupin family protein
MEDGLSARFAVNLKQLRHARGMTQHQMAKLAELPPGARMTGVPHTPGAREYLTCETGEIVLVAAGETWKLAEGDVVAFRGDQRHSYANAGSRKAIGYSIVVVARLG